MFSMNGIAPSGLQRTHNLPRGNVHGAANGYSIAVPRGGVPGVAPPRCTPGVGIAPSGLQRTHNLPWRNVHGAANGHSIAVPQGGVPGVAPPRCTPGVGIAPNGLQRTHNLPRGNVHGAANGYSIAVPRGGVPGVAPLGRAPVSHKEKILEWISKHAKKIIEICRFTVGMSLILNNNDFKIVSDMLDALSDFTRFILHIIVTRHTQHALPDPDRSFKAYLYDAEKQDIVFKRLFMSLASACKVFLKVVPKLVRFQTLSKLLPYFGLFLPCFSLFFQHFGLFLDSMELVLKLVLGCKKLTEDGFNGENMIKITAALAAPFYHLISCVIFMLASSVGGTLAYILLADLFVFFHWLAEEGMKDVALLVQTFDKLVFNNKIANEFAKSIHSFIGLLELSEEVFRQRSNDARKWYLSVIGLKVCMGIILRWGKDPESTNENPS